MAGVDQREYRLERGGILARRSFQRGHAPVERCTHGSELQVQFGQGDLGQNHRALRNQGLHPRHACRGLLRLKLHGVELGLRGALRGARPVDILGGDIALRQQRLGAPQCIRRLGGGCLCAFHRSLHRLRVELLRVDRTLVQHDLLVQRDERGLRAGQRVLVRTGVDLEQQVALLDGLVVTYRELDDAAVDLRHHVDGIGIDIGIVGARRAVKQPDHEQEQCQRGEDQYDGRPSLLFLADRGCHAFLREAQWRKRINQASRENSVTSAG